MQPRQKSCNINSDTAELNLKVRPESRKFLATVVRGSILRTCSGAGIFVPYWGWRKKEVRYLRPALSVVEGKDPTMADRDKDLEKIKQLVDLMKENGLIELQIEHDDDKIVLKRAQPQQAVSGIPVVRPESFAMPTGPQVSDVPDQSSAPNEDNLLEITSPIVGTFYATPSPDSDPFVEIGSQVTPQTVVCIIEAMKVMNEIKAEKEGTIVETLVKNGQAVEYGQVLFKVRPD